MFYLENGLVSHSISIDERKSINITGVSEVVFFDDVTVNIKSIMGKISIKGDKLHIVSFDEDIGVLNITGLIHGVIYIADSNSSGGFLSKLFR